MANKREGDGGTPKGTFRPRQLWWRADRHPRPRTFLPVRAIRPDDAWCEDPRAAITISRCGSTAITRRPADARRPSLRFHRRDRPQHLAARSPAAAARCSCIWRAPDFSPTAGCVSMTRSAMLRLLRAARAARPRSSSDERHRGKQTMLDNNQIAAAVTDPARSLARRHQVRQPRSLASGRATAPRATRSRRRSKTFGRQPVRLEDRRHQRGRTETHQCRRPDGRPHPGRDGDRRWRHGFDGRQRDARRRTRIRLPHGSDLPPRAQPYTVQEVLDAVGTLHPAIEIPDSRFADFVSAGEAQIIADNACAHLFVLGRADDARTGARSISSRRGRSSRCAASNIIGHGKNVLGDPRVALAWLANELRQLGMTLRAGEVVTTGTCHPPLPIQAGDLFAADFGVARQGVGRVR